MTASTADSRSVVFNLFGGGAQRLGTFVFNNYVFEFDENSEVERVASALERAYNTEHKHHGRTTDGDCTVARTWLETVAAGVRKSDARTAMENLEDLGVEILFASDEDKLVKTLIEGQEDVIQDLRKSRRTGQLSDALSTWLTKVVISNA